MVDVYFCQSCDRAIANHELPSRLVVSGEHTCPECARRRLVLRLALSGGFITLVMAAAFLFFGNPFASSEISAEESIVANNPQVVADESNKEADSVGGDTPLPHVQTTSSEDPVATEDKAREIDERQPMEADEDTVKDKGPLTMRLVKNEGAKITNPRADFAKKGDEIPVASIPDPLKRETWRYETTRSNPEEALLRWTQVVSDNPEDVEALTGKAYALALNQRFDDALVVVEKAVSVDIEFADAHAVQSFILFGLDRNDDAMPACNRALELNHRSVFALTVKGTILGSENRFEEARQNLEMAVAIDPHSYEALWMWGVILFLMDDFSGAMAACDRSLESLPDYEPAQFLRRRIFAKAPSPRAATSSGASLKSLGPEPHNYRDSVAYTVSADGKVVGGGLDGRFVDSVGSALLVRYTSLIWKNGESRGLGDQLSSAVLGLSQDGSMAIVRGTVNANNTYLWTESTNEFEFLISDKDSFQGKAKDGKPIEMVAVTLMARDISDDGKTIVGKMGLTPKFVTSRFIPEIGFVWRRESGLNLLDSPPGEGRNAAHGVSGNGSVFVGHVGFRACFWKEDRQFVKLSNSEGDGKSQAYAASHNGSVIVGEWTGPKGREAFRWEEDTGLVGLGDLDGGEFESVARDVSADGSVVVGWGAAADGYQAAIWTESHGMRSLQAVLVDDYGLDVSQEVTGWVLQDAYSVSADGKVIVGTASSPQGKRGWVVRLP